MSIHSILVPMGFIFFRVKGIITDPFLWFLSFLISPEASVLKLRMRTGLWSSTSQKREVAYKILVRTILSLIYVGVCALPEVHASF